MSTIALTEHAAERWLERGIPVTAAVEKWLNKIGQAFTSSPAKFSWGKGRKRITVVGVMSDKTPVVITVY